MHKPSNSEFSRIFDAAAVGYDSGTNAYSLARRIEFVLARASGTCLEVGAGTGEISSALRATHQVTATDISPHMVEEAKRKGLSAVVCDAEHLPFPDQSFDTVVCGEGIYYLDHPERFVAESFRVLRREGHLLLTFATTMTTLYDRIRTTLRILGFSNMYFDDKMHNYPSVSRIRGLVVDAGFSVEEELRYIVLPIQGLDRANGVLEKTPLKYLAAFAAISAKKS